MTAHVAGMRRMILRVLNERGGTGELYTLPAGCSELVVPPADGRDMWVAWGRVNDATVRILIRAGFLEHPAGEAASHSPHSGCLRPDPAGAPVPRQGLRPHFDCDRGTVVSLTDSGRAELLAAAIRGPHGAGQADR